jgi:predicted transposase/invertase (TIGR01784 family)
MPFDDEREVVSIEYETGELLPELELLKHAIVDVRCKDNFGRIFVVEMQLYWTTSFKMRVLFTASNAYVKQLERGKKFNLLHPVYSINFVNGIFERAPEMADVYYHHYKIVNIEHTNRQIKGLEFVFIELPKFKPKNRVEKKLQELWLRFLTEINEDTDIAPDELMACAETEEAIHYMEVGAYSREQLQIYDNTRIGIMTAQSFIDDAEEKGMAKGLAKGKEIGMAEGKEIGMAEGERKKETEFVNKLANKNMTIEQIAQFTDLSIDTITQILNNK